jgi:uncharacterized protein (TIGR03067 family)
MTINFLFLVFVAAWPQEPSAAEQADLNRMQGTWRLVEVAYDGITEKPENERLLTITGNQFIPGDDPEDKAAIKLDPTKIPAWLDLIEKNNKVTRGIYRLTGNKLTIAVIEGDGPRPEKFEAPARSRIIVLVLERVRTR